MDSRPSTTASILGTFGTTMSRLPTDIFWAIVVISNGLSLKPGKGTRHKRPKLKGSISRIITLKNRFEKLSCHHFSTMRLVQVLRLMHCRLRSNKMRNMGIIFISDAVSTIKLAVKDYKAKRYDDANIGLSSVIDASTTCEDGFKENDNSKNKSKNHVVSPLTKRNDNAFQLTAISLSIINMLRN
uniref:Pectinesterase inhibitor domain-containing protein n=1 Tax=Cannabis sativa TaxID=3483 RepID=A0A803NHS7_CANSA